jgi:hypothetical protein
VFYVACGNVEQIPTRYEQECSSFHLEPAERLQGNPRFHLLECPTQLEDTDVSERTHAGTVCIVLAAMV